MRITVPVLNQNVIPYIERYIWQLSCLGVINLRLIIILTRSASSASFPLSSGHRSDSCSVRPSAKQARRQGFRPFQSNPNPIVLPCICPPILVPHFLTSLSARNIQVTCCNTHSQPRRLFRCETTHQLDHDTTVAVLFYDGQLVSVRRRTIMKVSNGVAGWEKDDGAAAYAGIDCIWSERPCWDAIEVVVGGLDKR